MEGTEFICHAFSAFPKTVDNAAANIAVTDVAQPVKIEIPLSQSLTAWPTEWAKLYVKVKTTGIQKILVGAS